MFRATTTLRLLTQSLSSPTEHFRWSNIAFYGIKRPVQVCAYYTVSQKKFPPLNCL